MKRPFISLIFLMFLSLLVWPQSSYADWGGGNHPGNHGAHQYFRYHDHPHYGYHVAHFYPNEYFPVWVGGVRYYYDDGIYYNYSGGDYVVEAPPVGAIVSAIPSDFQAVAINGVTYYTNNGTYYVHTPSGYKVVSQPAVVQGSPVVVGTQNTYVVNVPTDRGGFVTINLRRSGNGFVGPQGEFYATFPRVSQLKVVYGR